MLNLFLSFFKVGLVGYGGGPASLPLVKREIVDDNHIIDEEELIEIVAMCNMLPGPLITKVAAVIGYREKKILGSISAVLGMILPSTVLLYLILEYFFELAKTNTSVMGMVAAIVPVVAIMMLSLVVGFIKKTRVKVSDKSLILQLVLYYVLLKVLSVNAVYVIGAVILISVLYPVPKEIVQSNTQKRRRS